MPRPWDEEEIRYLIKHAGRDTVTDIASALSRSRHDVRREASVRGLNVLTPRSTLVRCPECGCGRIRYARNRGVCRVCSTNAAIDRTEAAMYRELAAAPASVRGRICVSMADHVPPRKPRRPDTTGMTPAQAQRAVDRWLAAVEIVELEDALNRYNTARQRLFRVRAAAAAERRRGCSG